MTAERILFIAHNHPGLHPGGTEIFAHDLFMETKRAGNEALFLACTNQVHRTQKPGTNFQTIGRSGDELLLWAGHFDRFNLSQVDTHGMLAELADLLSSWRPDIVHFHHLLLIGAEALFAVRRVLPKSRIVMTLHDYYPICAHEGQMVRTADLELCRQATVDDCHRCFPDKSPIQFVLREKYIKAMLEQVDQFVSPSRFLADRYIAWGLPGSRIEVIPNGRNPAEPAPPRSRQGYPVFGVFGNISRFKGTLTAVKAANLLTATQPKPFELRIHGGMPFQSDAFKTEFSAEAAKHPDQVIQFGPYDSRSDLTKLMSAVDCVIVPSIWWENAPLVIQEAFQHKRPVICSDIGGMAEMVTHETNGLHFRTGNHTSLAQAMARVINEPDLLGRLTGHIPAVPTLAECAMRYRALYTPPTHNRLPAQTA